MSSTGLIVRIGIGVLIVVFFGVILFRRINTTPNLQPINQSSPQVIHPDQVVIEKNDSITDTPQLPVIDSALNEVESQSSKQQLSQTATTASPTSNGTSAPSHERDRHSLTASQTDVSTTWTSTLDISTSSASATAETQNGSAWASAMASTW